MDRRIFTFWTGDNPMSDRRAASLRNLHANAGCDVVLVTPDNLADFVAPDNLHPGYPHLSYVHRSDYLRAYFMRHFGGGYSDIKSPSAGWESAFAELEADPGIWVSGYRETGPSSIANLYAESTELGAPAPLRALAYLHRKWLQLHWRRLIGCGAYICRPETPLVEAWWRQVNARLDHMQPALQSHPARSPRDRPGAVVGDQVSSYPVPWTHLNGAVFQPLCLRYVRHVSQGLPRPDLRDYL